jgi:hypothetical protein
LELGEASQMGDELDFVVYEERVKLSCNDIGYIENMHCTGINSGAAKP